MKTQQLIISTLFAALLALAGFGAAAESPHDCAAHCASHTDKDAKMCVDHCKNGGVAWDHACATHCASQAGDDKDQMCAKHCASM
ncbi:MAG: hypothetical protein ACHBNF_11490 [Chromatiales bacterium]